MMDNRQRSLRHAGMLVIALGSLTLSNTLHAKELIFEDKLDSLQQFTDSGSLSVGSNGVRLRGGFWGSSDGAITSHPIQIEGYQNLEISFQHFTNRLDNDESGMAAYSVDGSELVTLSSTNSANGNATFALNGIPQNAQTLTLHFSVDTSSFFESYRVQNIKLKGERPDPTDPTDPGEGPDVTAGQQQYLFQCASCHGETAEGDPIGVPLNVPLNKAAAITATHNTMPPIDPSACDLDCATEIVEYLALTYWGDTDPEEPTDPVDPEPTGPILGEGTPDAGRCTDSVDLSAPILSNSLGFDLENTRNAVSAINSSNVDQLEFKFAHVAPNTESKRGAPAVTEQAVFVIGSNSLHAFNRTTGCEYWQYESEFELRTSSVLYEPSIGMVFVGDRDGSVHAVDAKSGQLRWKDFAGIDDSEPSQARQMLTGGMLFHDGKLIVPVSSIEVFTPIVEPCCDNHGMVRAYDALTGMDLWQYHTTEAAMIYGDFQGPSGAPVWSTPTIDVARNSVYFGTGQNYSEPATMTSDAIIAVDLDTGKEKWIFQARTGDVWTLFNDDSLTGLDFDFGASPILVQDGRTLIAGDKSGTVYSLNPESGALNWKRQLGVGSKLGGVHWNMAADASRVYVGIADKAPALIDPDIAMPDEERPGVFALDLNTGDILWEQHPTHMYQGEEFNSSFSASVAVTNDVVFAGSLDGVMHAFKSSDGTPLWTFDTDTRVQGINGILGSGGTIDSVGPVIGGSNLLINSGYNVFGGETQYQGGPGNATFVLGLPESSEPTDPEEPTDPVDPTEPTEPEEPTDPVDPTEPTEPDFTVGAELYEQQCSGCHGDQAQGGTFPALDQATDFEGFVGETTDTMPPRNPGSCDTQCATAIAEYLRATYW
ncbi:MAG: hypothetical protein D6160_11135 [Ketobacter sp.]|nr:MAG: hypothetical protein D6160_11135 [Ketobacter sp.]